MTRWYLEGYIGTGKTIGRVNLTNFPFQAGRQQGLHLTLPSSNASRIHAEIHLETDNIYIEDKGSTNGTFVNQEKVQGRRLLLHGDIIHFADCEFRIMEEAPPQQDELDESDSTVFGMPQELPSKLPAGARELQQLIQQHSVQALYQPIVGADAKTLVGYEVLGRGNHPDLSPSPGLLFEIAESYELATELSEVFRDHGIFNAARFQPAKYFLNIHPHELRDYQRLMNSFEMLRKKHPELPLVFEVHEEAVTDLKAMRQVKADLDNLGIELAYDDFGAGQARLMELVEVPPRYLKFDRALVMDIDQASEAKREMVEFLVGVARKMGTETLAECVETAAEVEVCKEIGFDLYQGYFIEKPMSEPNYPHL